METPADLLIREHRHIEKMVKLIRAEIKSIQEGGRADIAFIEIASKFIDSYIHRTHQPKEEILFDRLSRKAIKEEDFNLMCDMAREHKDGKQTLDDLFEAIGAHEKGDTEALPLICEKLTAWVRFYSEHVKTEETVFFPHSQRYFNQEESLAMIKEFRDFNEVMIRRNKELLKKVRQNTLMAQGDS